MASVTDQELEAAEAKGRELLAREPRAVRVRYDNDTRRIELELSNGSTYGCPVELVQDLHGADDDALGAIEIDGAGFNLYWPKLDVDLYVPALVAGVFGTKRWMASEVARQAGQVRSRAKTAAARLNGAKGGRPRKRASA